VQQAWPITCADQQVAVSAQQLAQTAKGASRQVWSVIGHATCFIKMCPLIGKVVSFEALAAEAHK